MSSSGLYATTFRITIYFFKMKKRFKLTTEPLLLIHRVVQSLFIQIRFFLMSLGIASL